MCWAERDEAGKPYPPLWIKTKNVRKPLIEEYLSKRAPRLLEIDARPLDTLVQRSVAQAAMKVMGMNETFGRVHEIEIGALSLRIPYKSGASAWPWGRLIVRTCRK